LRCFVACVRAARPSRRAALLGACALLLLTAARPSHAQRAAAPQIDLAQQPTLYVVGYAHLDTQWRWTYVRTIRDFLPATLHDNFKLFEQYPGYVFNFSGSRRYEMMREYYPADYAKLREWIAAGRWFPCGSSVDENDANVPSAESLVRTVLYGNRYFRAEFGVASDESMLPDCFGFPAALPSVLAHCGLSGFSTQKLTWNSVVPIPFPLGVWEGPDGRGVVAALDPGAYVGEVLENLATSNGWRERIRANAQRSGVQTDYHYYGTGDQGGAPTERSVAMVEQSLATEGPLRIVAGPADWLFQTLTPEQRAALPRYRGELQLTEHSAGSITSQAAMKRWNRKNELLADAAERAAAAAWWLAARSYPARRLESAWSLVLGSQMHDILPGTSHPTAYEFSWNDELIAANQFSAVLEDSAQAVGALLDTQVEGVPLILYNPLAQAREDVVEAELPRASAGAGALALEVRGPDGLVVPAQVLAADDERVRIAFLARVPSVGFAVHELRWLKAPSAADAAAAVSALRVSESELENACYRVRLDEQGDVASIHDKRTGRELLAAPARLGLHYENPAQWPAWNQDWSDRQLPVRELVAGPAHVRIAERGPARVALEVERQCGASTFVQTIRLSAGSAGERLEFDTRIDWNARERSLRASFPLSFGNPSATYDLQVGTLERGNGHAKQYEYAAQQWFDLSAAQGGAGVSILNDCKYGSDKPDDHMLRLTLLHTPGTQGGYEDQGTQDIGRHRVLYALLGHAGDWRAAGSAQQAARLNQPIAVFRASKHAGALGRSFSLLSVSEPAVAVSALKKAEDSDELIVRVRELTGRAQRGVKLSAAAPITAAREVDGQERPIGPARVVAGALELDIGGYELRAYALKLGATDKRGERPRSLPVALAYDCDVLSENDAPAEAAMEEGGLGYPAEQVPASLQLADVAFTFGPGKPGALNALACRGQELELPLATLIPPNERVPIQGRSAGYPGGVRLMLLAAASEADVRAAVEIDGQPHALHFRRWNAPIGAWDTRLWLGEVPEETFGWSNELGGLRPGFVKPETIAWHASHHHRPAGDAHYESCYLWAHELELPAGVDRVKLPNDPRIKIFAASLVFGGGAALELAAPLFDTLEEHVQDAPRIEPSGGAHRDTVELRIEPRLYWAPGAIRYTLDGSAPSASSAVYRGPLHVSQDASVRALVLDAAGRPGPIASAELDVSDETPPSLLELRVSYASKRVELRWSEPLDSAALGSYAFEPALELRTVAIATTRACSCSSSAPLRSRARATSCARAARAMLRPRATRRARARTHSSCALRSSSSRGTPPARRPSSSATCPACRSRPARLGRSTCTRASARSRRIAR
jgi:alpha-mannosidase